MKASEIFEKLNKIVPIETQESWDNCGWQIFNKDITVKKIMVALTPTSDILSQAQKQNCNLILAHHPLFFVPFSYGQEMPILSFHTCLDKVQGGTTDTLIDEIGFNSTNAQKIGDFLRIINLENHIQLQDLTQNIKSSLNIKDLRVVNNKGVQNIKKLAFCAGSGADFIDVAKNNGAEILITGDIKYHNALDSDIILIDVGHFESERPVLYKLKKIVENFGIEVEIADEKSPFIIY